MAMRHLAFILLSALAVLAPVGSSSSKAPEPFVETISTSACDSVRRGSYRARLDVFYLFLMEWHTGVDLDVDGIDRALAAALVAVLNDCDSSGMPMYAVEISKADQVEQPDTDGLCLAVQGQNATQCRLIRGKISVLFDTDVRKVEQLAYFVIDRVMNDASLLNAYTTMQVSQAQLVRPMGDNLVVLAPGPTGSTENSNDIRKTAIASGFASFAVTIVGVVCLIYWRRPTMCHGGASRKSRLCYLAAKHRQFFQELNDDETNTELESGWMVTESNLRSPSIAWSVSDLTFDSVDDTQSIRSTLPLDSIIEVFSDEDMASGEREEHAEDRSIDDRDQYSFTANWSDALLDQSFQEYPSTDQEQYTTPPRGYHFRRKYGLDDSLSVAQGSPTSTEELAQLQRNILHELELTPISLVGCRFLDSDMETSDELDISHNTDQTPVRASDKPHPLDFSREVDGTRELSDDDLLFSDDEFESMEQGDPTAKTWSLAARADTEEHALRLFDDIVVETVMSSDDEEQLQRPLSLWESVVRRLELSKSIQLLTYCD